MLKYLGPFKKSKIAAQKIGQISFEDGGRISHFLSRGTKIDLVYEKSSHSPKRELKVSVLKCSNFAFFPRTSFMHMACGPPPVLRPTH